MKWYICLVALTFIVNVFGGWVKEMENPGLYEGDMILSPEQQKQVKEGTFFFSSTNNKNKLWPNAVVPYEVNYDLEREPEAMKELKVSIEQYHKYTCLKFVKRTTQRGYIHFYKGGGCSSIVGYSGARNRISLSKGCWWRSTIMHEIGHSLGFHHEQSRPDRDQYVKILYGNIYPGTDFNFKKQTYQTVDSLKTPYDFRSMMHYSWNAFGKDQKMTIQTLDPSQQYEIGQDEGFSHIDIEQLNKLYNCKATYPTLPPYVKPPPGCYDLGGACAKGAFDGHCTQPSWKSYMHSKCRRSCRLCGDGGTPPTRPPIDTVEPQTMPPRPDTTTMPPRPDTTKGTGGGSCRDRVIDCYKQSKDTCKDSRRAWREFMEKSCRKYCNFC